MATIKIQGSTNLDTDTRKNAMLKINKFDTITLMNIAELLDTEKAQLKFNSNKNVLKTFI